MYEFAAILAIMVLTLLNRQIYKSLTDLEEIDSNVVSPGYYDFMSRSKQAYEDALTSLPNPEPPEEYKGELSRFLGLYRHQFNYAY